MSEELNRRKFFKRSLMMTAGAAGAVSLEERVLMAKDTKISSPRESKGTSDDMQMGKIGNLQISRLICGGNLISGFAHSRELIYVSSLLKHYFTDDKIIETLRLSEENGINTALLRTDEDTVRILRRYWKEEGGKIQWIAQTYPKDDDLTSNIKMAIDNGAVGAFMQGGIGDSFYKMGRVDLLGEVVSFVKQNGLIAGVGSHLLDVPMAVEKEGIKPDFYMKTLNNVDYHSADPRKAIEFMKTVQTPWIAYKVLGAGVTIPRRGFKYAFRSGADFITVGMYDFQIKEDADIAKEILSENLRRTRPWRS